MLPLRTRGAGELKLQSVENSRERRGGWGPVHYVAAQVAVPNDRDADGRALMLAGEGRGGCYILQATGGRGVAAGLPVTCLGSQHRERSWAESGRSGNSS